MIKSSDDKNLKTVHILAVDDHKLILRGYELVLQHISILKFKLKLDVASTFYDAIKLIDKNSYDIVFLDLMLEPSEKMGGSKTGEDIGIYLREFSPGTKIIFQSSFDDNLRINSVFKSVNPEGYIVKTELNDNLEEAIDKILAGGTFYSSMVHDAFRKVISQNVQLSENEKEVLRLLSLGVKTKDLNKHTNMSARTVERCKTNIKSLFNIENENDLTLVIEARKRGFL